MKGRKLLPGNPALTPPSAGYEIRRDTLEEVMSGAFCARLERLNAIVLGSGETPEGNIFYPDQEAVPVTRAPVESLAPARRNLWRAARFKQRLLEVGVNAGHSALLALSSSPRLEYFGVDLNVHAYTADCVEFLSLEFPGRVHFFPGDFREVLPWLASRGGEFAFDFFHVDGGHTDAVCRADVGNCIRLAKGLPGRHLMIDDVHASWIFDIVCECVAAGALTEETLFGDWEDAGRNLLAKIL